MSVNNKLSSSVRSQLPKFLVIGGMKCGSTTLFDDLQRHPEIKFPEKELSFFSRENCTEKENLQSYQARFPEKYVWGDCSTHYSMLSTFPGTAARARRVLGGSVPIIYMVRNPIERCLSHHHHLVARGATDKPFDEALQEFPEIVEYSKYDLQLEPWINNFDKDQILVVPIENYNSDWKSMIVTICKHIGVSADPFNGMAAIHSNRTANAHVARGLSRTIYESSMIGGLYRNTVRSFVPARAKNVLRQLLLPKPPQRVASDYSRVCLEKLALELEPTVDAVAKLIPTLDWDLSQTIDNHCLEITSV